MAWVNINILLSVSSTTIACDGGVVSASVTVIGVTDAADAPNSFVVSLRDDHVIPDVLWDSGPLQAGPSERVEEHFDIELFCNKKRQVTGPHGSSYEQTAEIYAHVLAGELESQSDDISVHCDKS